MIMNKGDFVRVDFTGRVAGTGEIFDLTQEDVARKEGIYNPKQKYQPIFIIIGARMAIPGVEKSLEAMQPGQVKEFVVPYREAYGPRNPKLIKIVPISNFFKQNIHPQPGMFAVIDNVQCRISAVSGGRVRVDFNNPLSGKDLQYRMKIVEHITRAEDKVRAMLDYYHMHDSHYSNGTLEIITEKPLGPNLEKMISDTTKKWIPEVKSISFSVQEKAKEKEDKGENADDKNSGKQESRKAEKEVKKKSEPAAQPGKAEEKTENPAEQAASPGQKTIERFAK